MVYIEGLYMYIVLTINLNEHIIQKETNSYKAYMMTSHTGYHTRPPNLPVGYLHLLGSNMLSHRTAASKCCASTAKSRLYNNASDKIIAGKQLQVLSYLRLRQP